MKLLKVSEKFSKAMKKLKNNFKKLLIIEQLRKNLKRKKEIKSSRTDLMKKILRNISKWLKNKDNNRDLEILRKRKLIIQKESHLKLENKMNSRLLIRRAIMDSKNKRKWKSSISEEKIDK